MPTTPTPDLPPVTAGAPSAPLVMHFVSGGFSGATQVAVDLALAGQASGRMRTVLVLRRKSGTPMDRVEHLRARGLDVRLVPGWAHVATVWALRQLCEQLRPDVVLAHGFPEHLIGRKAAVQAGVPKIIQVEHNSRERYTWWRSMQARRLDVHTHHIVAVSEGVAAALRQRQVPADRLVTIPNGIDLARFATQGHTPLAQRERAIVMAARFARQKDHATLIRAMAVLRERGITDCRLYLAGGGKASHRRDAEALVTRLRLQAQVQFLGHHQDMPGLLGRSMMCVLSTHYEGIGLTLLEGMAAGCVAITSDVPGAREAIQPGQTGLLFGHQNAQALTDHIQSVLAAPQGYQAMADLARAGAAAQYSRERMLAAYERLVVGTASPSTTQPLLALTQDTSPQVFFINLARDRDRAETLTQAFASCQHVPQRFEAVDWRALSPAQQGRYYSPALNARTYFRPLTAGECGCYASHVEIWRQLLNSDRDVVVVLEDDVEPDTGFDEAIAAISRLPGFVCRLAWYSRCCLFYLMVCIDCGDSTVF